MKINKTLSFVLMNIFTFFCPVWASQMQSFGDISLTEITPRILTPNGDSRNDKVFFKFIENLTGGSTDLTGIPIDTAVYSITGAKVGTLNLDLNDSSLSWDGKNTVGESLPAGIYIYSITIGKKSATGTVVVAK